MIDTRLKVFISKFISIIASFFYKYTIMYGLCKVLRSRIRQILFFSFYFKSSTLSF